MTSAHVVTLLERHQPPRWLCYALLPLTLCAVLGLCLGRQE